jgi:transcription elongation GreA/GreB family factor
VNGRILSLQDRIASAILIQTPADDGVVRIGSTVTIASVEREMTFQILGSQETNPQKGRISYSSPLGAALIGHMVGEEVAANGTTYHIVRVT